MNNSKNSLWVVCRHLGYDGISDDTFLLFDTKDEANDWIEMVSHLVEYGELRVYEAIHVV